jgi:hypothetical protein
MEVDERLLQDVNMVNGFLWDVDSRVVDPDPQLFAT